MSALGAVLAERVAARPMPFDPYATTKMIRLLMTKYATRAMIPAA